MVTFVPLQPCYARFAGSGCGEEEVIDSILIWKHLSLGKRRQQGTTSQVYFLVSLDN